MRLVSDFKDYYDGIQGMDTDRKPMYVRKNHLEFIASADNARRTELAPLSAVFRAAPTPPQELAVKTRLLGFCGVLKLIYVYDEHAYLSVLELLEAVRSEREPRRTDDAFSNAHDHGMSFHSAHQAWRYRQHAAKRHADDKTHVMGAGDRVFYPFNERGWSAWSNSEGRLLSAGHDELFRLLQTPVFVYRGKRLRDTFVPAVSRSQGGNVVERNPVLKDMGWQRQVDPYTAWQELDMYLGNQLAVQEDPAPLSDELRRDAHGFDDRSFKQCAPGERKARRKARRKEKKA